MAGFIYFFPKRSLSDLFAGDRFAPAMLQQYGLADVLGDIEHVSAHGKTDMTGRGPGDYSGAMFWANTRGKVPTRAGYYPDFQRWTDVGTEAAPLWIGVDTEYPPTPEDLQRAAVTPGYKVTLADENEWEVPVIRRVEGGTNLPQDMYFDSAGQFQLETKAAYLEMWDSTAAVWNHVYGVQLDGSELEDPVELLFSEALVLCTRYLGINYRFGAKEQRVLRLIDTTASTYRGVLHAVVDAPRLAELAAAEKKNLMPTSAWYCEFRAWTRGLAPSYRPSRADLFLAAKLAR